MARERLGLMALDQTLTLEEFHVEIKTPPAAAEDCGVDLDKVQAEGLELAMDEDEADQVRLQREIQREGAQLERALEAFFTLNEYVQTRKSAVPQLGIDSLNIALEFVSNQLGLDTSKVLAIEGFDRRPVAAARWHYAQEGMLQIVDQALAKVIEWIRKFFALMASAIEASLGRSTALAAKARQIQARAVALENKGAPSVNAAIREPQMLRFFSHKGLVMGPEEIVKTYLGYTQQHKFYNAHAYNELSKAVELNAGDYSKESVSRTLQAIHRAAFSHLKDVGKPNQYPRQIATALPFANYEYGLYVYDVEGVWTKLEAYTSEDGWSLRAPEFNLNQRLLVLPASRIRQIALAVETDMIVGFYRNRSAAKSQLKQLEARMTQATKKAAAARGETYARSQENYAWLGTSFLRTSINEIISSFNKLASYELMMTRRILAYAEMSLSAYR